MNEENWQKQLKILKEKRKKDRKNKRKTPAKALTIISEESKAESDNESVIAKRKKRTVIQSSTFTHKVRKPNNILLVLEDEIENERSSCKSIEL